MWIQEDQQGKPGWGAGGGLCGEGRKEGRVAGCPVQKAPPVGKQGSVTLAPLIFSGCLKRRKAAGWSLRWALRAGSVGPWRWAQLPSLPAQPRTGAGTAEGNGRRGSVEGCGGARPGVGRVGRCGTGPCICIISAWLLEPRRRNPPPLLSAVALGVAGRGPCCSFVNPGVQKVFGLDMWGVSCPARRPVV